MERMGLQEFRAAVQEQVERVVKATMAEEWVEEMHGEGCEVTFAAQQVAIAVGDAARKEWTR